MRASNPDRSPFTIQRWNFTPEKGMLGLNFAPDSSALNGSESGASRWGDGHANRAKPFRLMILLRKRRKQVSEIGGFVFDAANFTDYSGPSGVLVCSLQAVRSPSGFALPAL
jgi:hypothetical protein